MPRSFRQQVADCRPGHIGLLAAPVLALALSAGSCASCDSITPSAATPAQVPTHVAPGPVAPGDWLSLKIEIWPDDVGAAYRVDPDGSISVPGAGARRVKLAGLAEDEAAYAIRKVYDDKYVASTVSVERISATEAAAVNAREIERLAIQLAKMKPPSGTIYPNWPYESLLGSLDDVMRRRMRPPPWRTCATPTETSDGWRRCDWEN